MLRDTDHRLLLRLLLSMNRLGWVLKRLMLRWRRRRRVLSIRIRLSTPLLLLLLLPGKSPPLLLLLLLIAVHTRRRGRRVPIRVMRMRMGRGWMPERRRRRRRVHSPLLHMRRGILRCVARRGWVWRRMLLYLHVLRLWLRLRLRDDRVLLLLGLGLLRDVLSRLRRTCCRSVRIIVRGCRSNSGSSLLLWRWTLNNHRLLLLLLRCYGWWDRRRRRSPLVLRGSRRLLCRNGRGHWHGSRCCGILGRSRLRRRRSLLRNAVLRRSLLRLLLLLLRRNLLLLRWGWRRLHLLRMHRRLLVIILLRDRGRLLLVHVPSIIIPPRWWRRRLSIRARIVRVHGWLVLMVIIIVDGLRLRRGCSPNWLGWVGCVSLRWWWRRVVGWHVLAWWWRTHNRSMMRMHVRVRRRVRRTVWYLLLLLLRLVLRGKRGVGLLRLIGITILLLLMLMRNGLWLLIVSVTRVVSAHRCRCVEIHDLAWHVGRGGQRRAGCCARRRRNWWA